MAKIVNLPKTKDRRQLATYMFIDPNTGLVSLNWLSFFQHEIGILLFFRFDNQPFAKQNFYDLFSFSYTLMDWYSFGYNSYILNELLNKTEYNMFVEHENYYQKYFVKNSSALKSKISISENKFGG